MSEGTTPNARRGLVAALSLAAAAAAHGQGIPTYSLTELPLTGFVALDDQGRILGRAILPCTAPICTQSDQTAVLDTATGALTGVPGYYSAINAIGQLAGVQMQRDAAGQIVRTVMVRNPDGSTAAHAAPALPATLTGAMQVRGFDAAGQVTLQYTDGLDIVAPSCATPYYAWVGRLGGNWTAAGAAAGWVSLSGQAATSGRVAGAAVAPAACSGSPAPYRAAAGAADGSLVDLHAGLPGSFSRAHGINDLAYAVGHYDTGLRTAPDADFPQGRPITHAIVWNSLSGARFDLSAAGTVGRLNGVNNRGEIVGFVAAPVQPGVPYGSPTPYAAIGNLATSGGLIDLNTRLAANPGGWWLTEALAVNAGGQIVARAQNAATSGWVLLTPTQPPGDPYATAPLAPNSLTAAASAGPAVQLRWVNAARNATRLEVERCRGSKCKDFARIALLPGDTAAYTDATVARATAYRYRVRAGNAAGVSAYSNIAAATTPR